MQMKGYSGTLFNMSRADQPHKLTFENFVARCTDFSNPINEKHRNIDYDRPETRAEWNGSKKKIPLWCKDHQKFFVQLPANHMVLGQGCPDCGLAIKDAKRRKADPVADFRKVHGGKYDYSKMVYANVQTKIEIVCPMHGSFWQKPNAHLTGHGCPACELDRRQETGKVRTATYVETYASRAAAVHKGAYSIIKMPTHSHDWATFHCPKHGEFTQQAHSHLMGTGCPDCGKRPSYTQKELAAFIESLGVEIEHDNRTVLGGKHIDVWVPSKRIGIEYNGSYWHTESRVGNKHREKYDAATAAGARLIHLFDFEWLERREAVENRLRALLGVCNSVGARTCELRKVDRAEASAFFKKYHTQGSGTSFKLGYGLFKDEVMLACASFGTGRYGGEAWEVLRYASVGRVQGGFSRLFSAFLSDVNPESVVSYCDLRWGNGELYRNAGFKLVGVTAPDYWYTSGQDKISRFKAQHRDKRLTERQWAEEHGYQKVLGVGHQKWVWK